MTLYYGPEHKEVRVSKQHIYTHCPFCEEYHDVEPAYALACEELLCECGKKGTKVEALGSEFYRMWEWR